MLKQLQLQHKLNELKFLTSMRICHKSYSEYVSWRLWKKSKKQNINKFYKFMNTCKLYNIPLMSSYK